MVIGENTFLSLYFGIIVAWVVNRRDTLADVSC